ncbi:MAG TPA: hydrogenase nickel incorporation protein HypA [Dictyoglomaceae bacterium]|nr:hydrogenase nickel incorporation protein HypA [Dictyoglomaceae bacterium]
MHEWALAEAVINSAVEEAQRKNLRSVAILSLKIGEVQQIDLEVFDFAIKELSKGTIVEGAKVEYKEYPAKIRCNSCGYVWKYADSFKDLGEEEKEAIHFIPETIHVYIHCPKCKSRDFDIEEGRGVWIEDIT